MNTIEHTQTTAVITFDYATLPQDAQDEARATAAQYRAYMQRTVEDAAAIGRRLVRLRDRLGYGQFLSWLKAELPDLSVPTAYRFMALDQNLGDDLLTVRNLPLTTAYQLAAP